jgi:hypothetical protein
VKWRNESTTDPDQIKEWFKQWPDARLLPLQRDLQIVAAIVWGAHADPRKRSAMSRSHAACFSVGFLPAAREVADEVQFALA